MVQNKTLIGKRKQILLVVQKKFLRLSLVLNIVLIFCYYSCDDDDEDLEGKVADEMETDGNEDSNHTNHSIYDLIDLNLQCLD